jgi:DNA-binding CsgD family transcriptional regulator
LICLHRGASDPPYAAAELAVLARLAPHLAEGLRAGLLAAGADNPAIAEAPGLVLLANDHTVAAATEAGGWWLDQLGHASPASAQPPEPLAAVAVRLAAVEAGATGLLPRLRLRTRSGRWAVLHASRLPEGDRRGSVAVIIEQASAPEVAELIVESYALTEREQAVTALVCQGYSTRQIAGRLFISEHTVQDHLKSIFHKVGVGSRRDLVAALMTRHYLAPAKAGAPVGPGGFFQ